MPITALYAALLGLVFVALTLQVVRARMRSKVLLGTGGDRLLERAVRAHANFSEFVPLILVLLALAEGLGLAGWILHGLGAVLVAARIGHAIGLSREPDISALRGPGAALTLLVLIAVAVSLLLLAIARLPG
ncbi:MAPEG family protein [Paeniroseomonas aquatica]|uniref:MAPEG family protein n=1 Tax=Paeniroseomonas aquatica TaxID=373043 RepID=A0ABT8A312_9PROT|nr:MAPEG family protein [Paeniroseomonas aquatica]MDN3563954.1 MAPEG family protein [Paeniroseomonas aquatica]